MKVYGLGIWEFSVLTHKTKNKINKFRNIGTIKGFSLNKHNEKQSLNKVDCSLMIKIFNRTPYYNGFGELKELCIHPRCDDILHGVSRLDLGGNSRPLSKVKIYELITLKDVLYLSDIENELSVGVRQAQKVFKACKLAIRAIEKEYLIKTINLLPDWDY